MTVTFTFLKSAEADDLHGSDVTVSNVCFRNVAALGLIC